MKEVSKKEKVMAIVVTYNRKELLRECIEALLNQSYNNCHVLVVDNASTDGTKEYINDYIKNKKIYYYNTGKNIGGAGGFNYGIKKACELECDYLWLMDDDCIVKKDSLNNLIAANNKLNGNYGFLSSKVLWKDNTICKMNVPKVNLYKKNSDWETSLVKIEMATFVSFFVKSSIVHEIGLPITDFFIWADDLEYTRRISKKYKCYLVNDSVVVHKSKNNIGSNIAIDEECNLKRYEYSYRNETYLYREYGLKGKIYYFLKRHLHYFKIIKNCHDNTRKSRINIIKKSFKIGQNFYPSVEYINKNNKKVLYMYGEWINVGGQETFTLNVLKSLQNAKSNISIDLFTPYESKNKEIEKNIDIMGGKIYAYNGRFINERGNKKDFYINTKKFLKEYGSNYDIVHINSGSIYSLAIASKLAKKYGIKKVIVHSHATGYSNLKHEIIKSLAYPIFKKNVDLYCGCSELALYWKFNKKLIKSNNYRIIKNSFNIDDFVFNKLSRNEYRKKFNLNNNFVIINVARLSEEKNQEFLIDVFSEVYNRNSNSQLLLVGDGPCKDELRNKITSLKLEKQIKLLGSRTDINKILQAADIAVFPSKFEGLGISAVESQTAGLVTICSENIPQETYVTDLCIKQNLSDDPSVWANTIIEHSNYNRKNMRKEIQIAGYDLQNLSKMLEELYY